MTTKRVKQTEFPERVESGSAFAMIYRTPKGKEDGYTVTYYVHGQRKRCFRSDYNAAKRKASSVAASLSKGDHEVLKLRDRDRLVYLRAEEALRPLDLPLDLAVLEFVAAKRLLEGGSLIEAAKYFTTTRPTKVNSTKLVAQVVGELLEAKETKARSKVYLRDLRVRLTRFAGAFHCPISAIETLDVETFINSMNVVGRTKNNTRATIGLLFNFARKKGYLPANHPGIGNIERANECAREIAVFTPEEMASLLGSAPDTLVPGLAICGFAGVRHEEMKRLDWESVKFDAGHIEIKALNAKTRVRRLIPISDNLRAWLLPYHRPTGPITNLVNMCDPYRKLAKKVGLKWKRNGLRHAYISYRVALVRDVQGVALEAGNSAKVIMSNYLQAVTEAEAKKWFGIYPAGHGAVIPLPRTVAEIEALTRAAPR